MQVGDRWGDPNRIAQGLPGYTWDVEAREGVSTTGGQFTDCYRLGFHANTGSEWVWFCPGVGEVRRKYLHGAAIRDEVWELVSASSALTPQRIQFAPGTASYEFTTTLTPGIPRSYVLRILAGQVLYISVLSEKEVSVAVLGPEGAALPVTKTGRPGSWSVDIPRTGDYTLVLRGEGEAEVTVYIPPLKPTPTPIAGASLGKLAYIKGGDVWVKELPGGTPQRLTTDGRNREPRWSPLGQWLAFRKGDDELWVMRDDGRDAHPVEKGAKITAFEWSPVEDRLAYLVENNAIRVINADGTGAMTLVAPTPSGFTHRIAWSPDGEWIAYDRQEPIEPGGEGAGVYAGLWRIRADGSEAIELFGGKVLIGYATPPPGTSPYGAAIVAGWSSDGRYILYWVDPFSGSLLADGVPLMSIPADGGEPVQLAAALDTGAIPSDDKVLAHTDFIAPAPATGANPTKIAITVGAYRATWMNKRVAVVEQSTGEVSFLTPADQAAFSPSWSLDGRRIAYVAMPDEGDLVGGDVAKRGMMARKIWVADFQSGETRQLTDDPAYRDERSLWSADGRYILFARFDAEGRASLWLIPAEGGEPQQVVDELHPFPGLAPGWFGYYGHVNWDALFDWWRGNQKNLP